MTTEWVTKWTDGMVYGKNTARVPNPEPKVPSGFRHG